MLGLDLCRLALMVVSTLLSSTLLGCTAPPDGAQGTLAFVTNRDGGYEIYAMNAPLAGTADASDVVNLTRNRGYDWSPTWSPDGTQIAFESDRDGNFEVYAMNADGSNVRRLTNSPGWDGEPQWSYDGRSIVFRSERDGNPKIF